jgi:hypothetical protein
VKIFASYLSTSRPLIESELCVCVRNVLHILTSCDLNAKHTDWNSSPIKRRDSCVITPTNFLFDIWFRHTIPYHPSATPDALDIVITRDLIFPVYPILCSTLSFGNLHLLFKTTCPSFFFHPPASMISGQLTGPDSKLEWRMENRHMY